MQGRKAPALVRVVVGGNDAPWRAAGFSCSANGFMAGDVEVALVGGTVPPSLVFDPACGSLDGVAATEDGDSATDHHLPSEHPNGSCGVDHVVVSSPDVERTSEILTAAGLELLGAREAQIDGERIEQRFHRAGPCLLELVGQRETKGNGPAEVWGLTFVTSKIEELPALKPPPVASIRDAVQPGRRIGTAAPTIGLPTRVAFMDPRRNSPK